MNLYDTVELLKCYTRDDIATINKYRIPLFMEQDPTPKTYYYLDGDKFIISGSDQILLSLNGIRFYKSTRYKQDLVFRKPMIDLINAGEMDTFLLFIDKKFIKWSDIEVVHDYKYNYLILNNQDDVNVTTMDIIYIPFNVIYNEWYKKLDDSLTTLFAFDKTGKSAAMGPINISIKKDTNYVYYRNAYSAGASVKSRGLDIDIKYFVDPSNLILFKDNLLCTDIPVTIDKLNRLTINSGTAGNYEYKLFYNVSSDYMKRNLNKVENLDYIISALQGSSTVTTDLTGLTTDFNFSYDESKSYDTNVSEAINYIMGYNKSLFNSIYMQNNTIIKEYTGKQLKTYIKNNKITMSRNVGGAKYETYVIIYQNNLVYSNYHTISYEYNSFTFDAYLSSIDDTDVFEFVYYKNVCNYIQDTKFSVANSYIGNEPIQRKDALLFSTVPKDPAFPNLERSTYANYQITSTLALDNTISLNDSFFYNKPLKEVSNKQFRYSYLVADSEDFKLKLAEEFSFCTDKTRYLVYLNGRLLESEYYELTAIKETNPVTSISVYLYMKVKANDIIEVFYIPVSYDILPTTLTLTDNGYLTTTDTLSYPLSKDLYEFYIDGKRIARSQIKDIDKNTIKITSNINTRSKVSIFKLMNPVEELVDKMDIASTWDSVISTLDDQTKNALFNTYNAVLSSDTAKYTKDFTKENIMTEIIRDYFMKPGANEGDLFYYDYDKSMFPVDSNGNTIIPTMDATKYISILDNE